jgi:hypothetical protein
MGPDMLTTGLRRTVTLSAVIAVPFAPRVDSAAASMEVEASTGVAAEAGN